MQYNFFLRCKTCSEILRIRVQAGYYNWIPFTYECPECKVVCKGEISIPSQVSPSEKKNNGIISNLKNCIHLEDKKVRIDESKWIVNLSSELYTEKIKEDPGWIAIVETSFMKYAARDIDTRPIERSVQEILNSIYSNSEDYTAYWNLYEKSSPYLFRKKKENGLKVKHKSKNENQKIGFIQDFLYSEIRQTNYYKSTRNEIISKLRIIRKQHFQEFLKLSKIISNNFIKLSGKLFTVTSNFLNYYNYILPVVLNEINQTYVIEEHKDELGIAQTDFEFLKSPFSENYEDLKDFLWIQILINNIYYRKDIKCFNEKFQLEFNQQSKNISKNLEIFNSQIKNVGNRVKILNYDPTLKLMNRVFDNELRNSIDHRDYRYDYNKQLITYFNKGVEKEIYLIELGERLFQGFLLANILWDTLMYIAEEGKILND